MTNARLSRRTILRGLGTAIALPALEAMLPSSAFAAPVAKNKPVRMAFFMVPNGVHMPAWRPAAEGPMAELPATLQPLSALKDKVTVFSGLAQHQGFALGDGAGDHARAASTWLTGCHPRKTAGADIKVGISVDQYAAQQVGSQTRFSSLELGCERGGQAGNCDSGYSCAYSSNIAWRSESTPVAKEVDPRLVFDRLFGGGDARELDESRERRDRYHKSILDFVLEDANRLKTRLGIKDQQKLDEYFTSVREIEKRIELAGKIAQNMPASDRPTGIPQEYQEHIRLMFDMMVLAFQTDMTRISTFMYANEGSNRPYRNIEISDGHHDLSHHQNDAAKQEKLQKINSFHISQLAYLAQKLDAIKEGDGTLLDNCMLVYGGGLSDGNAHNHDDLPLLMVGRGGGTVKSGRHLVFPREKQTPLNNLFLSMLDRMKVPVHSLGDSTGRLDVLG